MGRMGSVPFFAGFQRRAMVNLADSYGFTGAVVGPVTPFDQQVVWWQALTGLLMLGIGFFASRRNFVDSVLGFVLVQSA